MRFQRPTLRVGWLPLAAALLFCKAAEASLLPAGSLLELRLAQEINSYSARPGDPVRAVVIAPLVLRGEVIVPAGAIVSGTVHSVKRVGLGLIRERARLELDFTELRIEGAPPLPVSTRLVEVENAREAVDPQGRLTGIRSTATPGHRASALLTSLAAVDPIALAFSTAAFTSLLRFSEPEIHLVPGTELFVRVLDDLTTPCPTGCAAESAIPKVTRIDGERAEMSSLLRRIPFRTQTAELGQASDLTNILIAGSRAAIDRAFDAAGWTRPEPITAASRYRTLRALAENQTYREAPMSSLQLQGRDPVRTLSKALNTFSKRHHLRIYSVDEEWAGRPVFTASATQDIGIGFSARQRNFIHVIDDHIDNERAKVVNDLLFTGCVESAETMARPWVPTGSARNATGQRLRTDGAIAIVVLNDCRQPRRHDDSRGDGPPGPYRGPRAHRIARQTILTIRNDAIRGNVLWQGVSAALTIRTMLRRVHPTRPERNLDVVGERYEGDLEASRPYSPLPIHSFLEPRTAGPGLRGHRRPPKEWAPVQVELGFNFGGSLLSNTSAGAEGLIITRRDPNTGANNQLFAVTADNRIASGWMLGGTVTLHTHRWVSSELGFQVRRGEFQLGLQGVDPKGQYIVGHIEEQRSGFLARQFSYNTVVYARPPESRWRPYLAAGPAIQLVNLTEAPFRKAAGIFRIGLNNVGMIDAAYNFGSIPPLEGGGIFQPGMQIGGGIKYRLCERWLIRLDYRDTLTKHPDLLRKSLTPIVTSDPLHPDQQVTRSDGSAQGVFNSQRLTLGFSFTF